QPIRPIDTVDIDAVQKVEMLKDIEKYFHPDRAKWYSQRGVPYRRGILLHGPPGTGKSSVSTALAGHFESNMYIVNLREVQGEKGLKDLFVKPKKGDIVLMEDIDTAGIVRDENAEVEDEDTGLKRKRNQYDKGVTLSGLINVIDGVCDRSDGVLLIMTTNNPESLDKALVRPGRIDKQYHLGHVAQAVAEIIFKRIYQDDEATLAKGSQQVQPHIAELAKQFAAKVPDNKITPAEIQAHLIASDCPEQAVERADRWVADLLVAKE
ncbi:P-loop containing nucleoside triphosphate hydrolase protein, partial [Lophiotrema nucula]